MMKYLYSIATVFWAVSLCFSGCASTSTSLTQKGPEEQGQINLFVANKPEPLRPLARKLAEEGEQNEVLNLMKLGLNAMQMGYMDDAEWAFDKALENIETVYANTEQAAKVRSLWVEEGAKNFKGESYERTMAYYYRGLLYLMENDLQNARASFRGGILQDAFVEEEQYRCDFALLYYLGGWSSHHIVGDNLAEQYFQDLATYRPDIPVPDQQDNVLLVVETGKAPRKVADGVGHYQLKYRPGRKFSEKKVQFQINGSDAIDAHHIEDVFWQASTRGGRQFDYILAGKAAFKKQASAAGDVMGQLGSNAMLASTIFQNSASELQGIGATLSLAGAFSQYAAIRSRAEADIRYWNNLPDSVHVYSLNLPPGEYELSLHYLDADNKEASELQQNIEFVVENETSPLLVWTRSRQQIAN